MSKIVLTRYYSFFSFKTFNRICRLVVDNKDTGTWWPRASKELELEPGSHSMRIEVLFGLFRSPEVQFDIKHDQTLFFELQNNPIKSMAVTFTSFAAFAVIMFMKSSVQYHPFKDYGFFILLAAILSVTLFYRNNFAVIVEKIPERI